MTTQKYRPSTWRHRVVKQTVNGETIYGIHEVYSTKTREAHSCTVDPEVYNDSVKSLRWTLEHMLKALDEPVLDFNAIGKGESDDNDKD